jgi:hypothetical protein
MACEDKVFDYCGASYKDKYGTFEECIEQEFNLCGGTSSTTTTDKKLSTPIKVAISLAVVLVILKIAKVI